MTIAWLSMSNKMPSNNREENSSVLLQVRIPRDLRDSFMKVVREEDDNASRLVRRWVRDYLRQHMQQDLFSNE